MTILVRIISECKVRQEDGWRLMGGGDRIGGGDDILWR